VLAEGAEGRGLPLVATDALDDPGGLAEPRPTRPDDVALIQYTSGSTAIPRGVMVTHANILDNCEFIDDGFEFDPETTGMMWLPPYHDMGLVGGMFSPVHSGRPMTLMSPLAFLIDPLNWLATISRNRAATSGGPNFAFDLCVRKIAPERREGLDLSSWTTAYNGAEPVLTETMDAFVEAFGPCGFDRAAFYPCFGLAEATLMVSGGDRSQPPRVIEASREALERARFEPPADPGDAVPLTGCGEPREGAAVVIVDPDSRVRCGPGEIGEIWVSGTSVAAGYFNRPDETSATFAATLEPDGDGPYLRTGDLGVLVDGELFITGRSQELVVLDDRVLYPADIERVAERAAPALRHNCAAAFTIEVGPRRRLVLVAETRDDVADHAETFTRIEAALATELELEIAGIALIAPRTIPRTSSGKTRRLHCRDLYLRGRLEPVGEWIAGGDRPA
jgi:acyl-CoA synthetase (AMP-forming)/AMP-acid ligase II